MTTISTNTNIGSSSTSGTGSASGSNDSASKIASLTKQIASLNDELKDIAKDKSLTEKQRKDKQETINAQIQRCRRKSSSCRSRKRRKRSRSRRNRRLLQ